jgi:hypothetical protein
MKAKRIPKDFNIKEFDERGRVAISASGNMTKEIWENVTILNIFIFLSPFISHILRKPWI